MRLRGNKGSGGQAWAPQGGQGTSLGSFVAVTRPLGATAAFVNIDGPCEPSPRWSFKWALQLLGQIGPGGPA